MKIIVSALLALSSTIDPQVKFVVQNPQPGSNAWPQVVFNDYCYAKSGDASKTEKRTRAMLELLGKAAAVLNEKDTAGAFSMRTFYKNGEGQNVPRLHIVMRPESTTSAPAMDANAELADLTAKLAALGYKFEGIPAVISGSPAAFVGFLRTEYARINTSAANTEVQGASQTTGNADKPAGEEAPF